MFLGEGDSVVHISKAASNITVTSNVYKTDDDEINAFESGVCLRNHGVVQSKTCSLGRREEGIEMYVIMF